jgi:hypothetical protein
MTQDSLEHSVTTARREHLVPGREIHMQDMRGRRFCEVGLITGAGDDSAIANIWNTTGTCDPAPEQLAALDADAIARESGAQRAWLDPARQWVVDEIDVWEAGADRTFGDITGTWVGAASAATMMQTAIQGSYDPGYLHRNNTFTFHGGSEVYVLDAPDGEAFVMESFTRHWDSGLSEDNLAHLGSRLDLPADWGFRTEVLDRDMEVLPVGDDYRAHVLQDNLHNVYQGSDVGRAFSDICRQDSLR